MFRVRIGALAVRWNERCYREWCVTRKWKCASKPHTAQCSGHDSICRCHRLQNIGLSLFSGIEYITLHVFFCYLFALTKTVASHTRHTNETRPLSCLERTTIAIQIHTQNRIESTRVALDLNSILFHPWILFASLKWIFSNSWQRIAEQNTCMWWRV